MNITGKVWCRKTVVEGERLCPTHLKAYLKKEAKLAQLKDEEPVARKKYAINVSRRDATTKGVGVDDPSKKSYRIRPAKVTSQPQCASGACCEDTVKGTLFCGKHAAEREVEMISLKKPKGSDEVCTYQMSLRSGGKGQCGRKVKMGDRCLIHLNKDKPKPKEEEEDEAEPVPVLSAEQISALYSKFISAGN